MKNILYLFLFTAMTFVLAACPIETDEPLISRNKALAYKESMPGIWKNSNPKAEVTEVKLSPSTEKNIYELKVLKSSSDYWGQERFDAWFVSFNGYTYLITQPYMESKPANTYFTHLAAVFDDRILLTEFNLNDVNKNDLNSSEKFQEALKKYFMEDGFMRNTEEWGQQP